MRQSTAVNHENEYLMNGILRQMSSIYGNALNPYMVAKFVGVLLVLKKQGAFEDVDYNSPHEVLQNVAKFKLSADLISLSLEAIEEAKRIAHDPNAPSCTDINKLDEFLFS